MFCFSLPLCNVNPQRLQVKRLAIDFKWVRGRPRRGQRPQSSAIVSYPMTDPWDNEHSRSEVNCIEHRLTVTLKTQQSMLCK